MNTSNYKGDVLSHPNANTSNVPAMNPPGYPDSTGPYPQKQNPLAPPPPLMGFQPGTTTNYCDPNGAPPPVDYYGNRRGYYGYRGWYGIRNVPPEYWNACRICLYIFLAVLVLVFIMIVVGAITMILNM